MPQMQSDHTQLQTTLAHPRCHFVGKFKKPTPAGFHDQFVRALAYHSESPKNRSSRGNAVLIGFGFRNSDYLELHRYQTVVVTACLPQTSFRRTSSPISDCAAGP